MKNREEEKDLRNFLFDVVRGSLDEKNCTFESAMVLMELAELNLALSLNDKQKKLYKKFIKKRELFYKIAKEKYNIDI